VKAPPGANLKTRVELVFQAGVGRNWGRLAGDREERDRLEHLVSARALGNWHHMGNGPLYPALDQMLAPIDHKTGMSVSITCGAPVRTAGPLQWSYCIARKPSFPEWSQETMVESHQAVRSSSPLFAFLRWTGQRELVMLENVWPRISLPRVVIEQGAS
jgi:hypothetical protein